MQDFGMTAAGNKSIGWKLAAAERIIKYSRTVAGQVDAVEKIVRSYQRMFNCKSYPKANTPVARDCVFTAIERILIRSGGFSEHRAYEILDLLWEKYI